MRDTYKEYRTKVEEIRKYIATLQQLKKLPEKYLKKFPESDSEEPIEKELKNLIEELKKFVTMPQKRRYDYSLAIIILYGIFESYVEKIMCAYLNMLCSNVQSYSDLPESLRTHHIELSTKLMGTKSLKYRELKPSDIIAKLHSCLSQGSNPYQINIEAFTQHSTNFRMDSLHEFFSHIGITNIKLFITKDAELTRFIRTSKGLEADGEPLQDDTYFEKLHDLVERRNQVAHGSEVDELLSLEILDEYAQYISLLLMPIFDCLQASFYSILVEKKLVVCLGVPIRTFKNNTVVCINSNNNTIRLKDTIIAQTGEGSLRWGEIQSIMINSNPVTEVLSTQAADIGMQVDFVAKDTYTYYLFPSDDS